MTTYNWLIKMHGITKEFNNKTEHQAKIKVTQLAKLNPQVNVIYLTRQQDLNNIVQYVRQPNGKWE